MSLRELFHGVVKMLIKFRFYRLGCGIHSPGEFRGEGNMHDLLAGFRDVAITFGARHLHPTVHELFLSLGNPLHKYDCLVSNDRVAYPLDLSSFELVRLRL